MMPSPWRRPLRAARALAALAAAAGAVGCSGGAAPHEGPAGRVFLIGLDGATWDRLDPLLAAGRLPVLASLIEEGARTPLGSMIPTKSPALWTTVVTGKEFDKHGIDDFTEIVGEDGTVNARVMHMTSNMRATKALWNIVGEEFAEGAAFVGWWVSWPAEPVNGTIVSSHVPLDQTGGKDRPTKGTLLAEGPAAQTWPPALFEEIAPLIRPASSVTFEEARRFMDLRPEELERPVVQGFRWAFAADETYRAVARRLLETEPGRRLWGLYFNGIDVVSHRYWKYLEPEKYPPYPAEERPRFRDVIDRYYEYTDEVLGDVLEHRRPGDCVVVVSDHGFHARGHKDGPSGILVAAGAGIERGAAVAGARLVDVAPTVLALLGLPAADDMDGRVLEELFTPAWRSAYPRERLATYDDPDWLAARDPEPLASEVDAELMERLRALGYLE